MRYGIQTLSPQFFNGPPDIAVAGFNVGANLGTTVLISGTVGAATEAAKEGIPSIAFSGTTGSQTGYTSAVSLYETVYACQKKYPDLRNMIIDTKLISPTDTPSSPRTSRNPW